MGNLSFLYLPFETSWSMHELETALAKSGWQPYQEDERSYLHAYNFCMAQDSGALYAHFCLVPQTSSWEIASSARRRAPRRPVAVELHRMHCYLFSTGINILSFELSLLDIDKSDPSSTTPMSDPRYVSIFLSNLHRVGKPFSPDDQGQGNRIREVGDTGIGKTLLQLASEHMEAIGCSDADFFKHVEEQNARANVFTHVESPDPPELSIAREKLPFAQLEDERDVPYAMVSYLASLQSAYTYPWSRSMEILPTMVTYAPDVHWGISDEALACITYPQLFSAGKNPRGEFISRTLARNIRTQYQFLYVLLLHQKYEYYSLLSNLSSRDKNSHEDLLRFKGDLETFHADYVYSHVSDVAQYQTLYDKVYEKFDLAQMNTDVRKPLDSLAKLQQQEEKRESERREAEDKKREQGFNTALNVLALIMTLPALNDMDELRKKLVETINPLVVNGFFIFFVLIVSAVFCYSLYSLIQNKVHNAGGDSHDEQA